MSESSTTQKQVVLGLNNDVTDNIVEHLSLQMLPKDSRVYDVTYDPETKTYSEKVDHA